MTDELVKIKEQLDRMESKQNGEYIKMDKEIKDNKKIADDHILEDKQVHNEIRDFHKRMEPVLIAFDNKRVVRMAIEEETKTWVFYVTSITKFGLFLTGAYAVVKFIFFRQT